MDVNAAGFWRKYSLFLTFFLLLLFRDAVLALAQEGTESTSPKPAILSGYQQRSGYRGLFGTIGLIVLACIVIPAGVLSVLYLILHRCISLRTQRAEPGARSKGVFWIEERATMSSSESDIFSFTLSRKLDEDSYNVNRSEDDLESTCLLCDGLGRDRINMDNISLLTFNECDARSVATHVGELSVEMNFSDVKGIMAECETDANGFVERSHCSSRSDVITQFESVGTVVDNHSRPSTDVTGYNDVFIELMGKDQTNTLCCQVILSNDVSNESFMTELKLDIPEI